MYGPANAEGWAHTQDYWREMDRIRERFRPWDLALALVDGAIWLTVPSRTKKRLNRELLFQWSDAARRWE